MMSRGIASPPFALAVPRALIENELIPITLRKNVGTVALSWTTIPFAGLQGSPVDVKHFGVTVVVTLERSEWTFFCPLDELNEMALFVANVVSGRSCAPASAAASATPGARGAR